MRSPLPFAVAALCGALLSAQVPEPPTGVIEATNEASPDGTGVETVDADKNYLLKYMGAVHSTKPFRLAPGETGTLLITLSLHENAVLIAGEKLVLTYVERQEPFALGAWTIQPPKPVTLYPNMAGKVVHEKYAILEVPVHVAADAKHGKHKVRIGIEAQVRDGRTGAALALAKADIEPLIEVGRPVPTPVPIELPDGDVVEAPAGTSQPAARPTEGPQLGAPRTERTDPTGRFAETPPQQPAERPVDAVGRPADAVGTDNFLLYGLLGVVGIGILAVLLQQLRGKR